MSKQTWHFQFLLQEHRYTCAIVIIVGNIQQAILLAIWFPFEQFNWLTDSHDREKILSAPYDTTFV